MVNLNTKFEKLIKGDAEYQSANLGLNLLISRMKKEYSKTQTAQQLGTCVQEMNIFFDKYKAILSADIENITTL